MPYKTFVKSRDTKTPVSSSQVQLERILKRYGASGFGVQQDYEKHLARVFFRVPDDGAGGSKGVNNIPVRLEVNIKAVATVLGYSNPSQYGWEQAERVAWRHLVLWVDAAMSAAAAGVQKVSEAFLAHTLIKTGDGRVLRVVESMDAAAPDGNWRALLAPPTTSS